MAIANRNRSSGAGQWGRSGGAISWFLQRISAILVAVLVGLHLWQRHYGPYGKVVTFQNVSERLHNPWSLAAAIIFAGVVTFHTLNGLRAILLDFVSGRTAQTVILWIFILAVVSVFVVYVLLLLPFLFLAP